MKPAISLFLVALCANAHAFNLVTEEEFRASQAAPEIITPKSAPMPGAPVIELLMPNLERAVRSPTVIELRFRAEPQSEIQPDTFKVLYGRFRIDVTSRIISETRVTPEGIKVQEARLPAGEHRLILSVQDSKGRTGQREMEFRVD